MFFCFDENSFMTVAATMPTKKALLLSALSRVMPQYLGHLKAKVLMSCFQKENVSSPLPSQSKNCAVRLKFCTTFLVYSFSFYSKFDLNITVIRRNCFLKGLVTWLTDYMSILIVS